MTSQERNRNNMEIANRPKSRIFRFIVLAIVVAAAVFFGKSLLGKSENSQQVPQPQAPAVVLHTVEMADLAARREYIGRVEPIQVVALKPQVAGEIAQVHFKEGAMVKAGQLLFSLDNRQYRAIVELRKAELEKAEANRINAAKYYERLKAADERSVSASDLDMAESTLLQSQAAVSQAAASLKLAQIDLGYTRIAAPIGGQAGRALFTKGNYVTPSSGNLTTIVQIDPIRVTFSLPDRDYLEQLQAFKSSNSPVYDATIRLADGKEYPLKGERDFEDNAIDQRTGTIQMSLRFKNDAGSLIPGSMVRIETKPVERHVSAVIPQVSVLADSQGDYAYVVDDGDVVHQRRITLGMEIGTMREVLSGLAAGEKVIVRGLQSVRPEMRVKPAEAESVAGAGASKAPAERARESGYDLKIVSGDRTSGDKKGS